MIQEHEQGLGLALRDDEVGPAVAGEVGRREVPRLSAEREDQGGLERAISPALRGRRTSGFARTSTARSRWPSPSKSPAASSRPEFRPRLGGSSPRRGRAPECAVAISEKHEPGAIEARRGEVDRAIAIEVAGRDRGRPPGPMGSLAIRTEGPIAVAE